VLELNADNSGLGLAQISGPVKQADLLHERVVQAEVKESWVKSYDFYNSMRNIAKSSFCAIGFQDKYRLFSKENLLKSPKIVIVPIYQNGAKYTKFAAKLPNGHKMYQMAVIYSKWSKNISTISIPRPSNFLKIDHLTTLGPML
jgi:hypothetical protein